MNDQISEFIERRFSANCNPFEGDNSYWFAKILCLRFPSLKLCYDKTANTFIAVNEHYKKYYNIDGAHDLKGCIYVCMDKLIYDDLDLYVKLMQEFKD